MKFKDKVIKVIQKIPRGRIATYKQVAFLAARPKASRAVGNILKSNFLQGPKIPCHRVIKSNGEIGNYALGRKKKEEFLKQEGIKIKKHYIDLKSFLWNPKSP